MFLNSPPSILSADCENATLFNNGSCCAVCDNPQARNNFGIISCNACAAFFRRTLIQGRSYVCQCNCSAEEDSMDIPNPSTGEQQSLRDCKFCRFQKCVKAGMQQKAIRSMEVWKWRSEMSSKEKANNPNKTNAEKMARKRPKKELFDTPSPLSEDQDQQMLMPSPLNMDNNAIPIVPLALGQMLELELLADLMHAEGKLRRIHHSRSELPCHYFAHYGILEDVVRTQDNLLAAAHIFENKSPVGWLENFRDIMDSVWSLPSDVYLRDLMVSIGFGKSLPIFKKLDFNDQRILLSSATLPTVDLINCFYSQQAGSTVIIAPNGFPIIELFKLKKYSKDPIVLTMAKKIYCQSMNLICTLAPSTEEIALLLALMFTNSATTGLSREGQQLLRAEAEKYARALLRLQQHQLGDVQGALRYSNTLRLIERSIKNSQMHRELVVYMDLIHDQGLFEQFLPKAFLPFCLTGPCELPKLPGTM